MYIYYQSYEAREQISKRSRQARPKRIIQRARQRRADKRRRRACLTEVRDRFMETAESVAPLAFST